MKTYPKATSTLNLNDNLKKLSISNLKNYSGENTAFSDTSQVTNTYNGGFEGGVGLAPLLEGIQSALEEQTWLMWQMWSTHTAVELEIRLPRHGMDSMLEMVF